MGQQKRQLDSMGGALLGKQVKRQLDSLGGGYLGENQHKRKRRDLSSFHRRQLDSLGGGVLGEMLKRALSGKI